MTLKDLRFKELIWNKLFYDATHLILLTNVYIKINKVYSNLFKYVFLNEEYNMIPHGHTMNHDYINYFALNELLPSFHITKARPNE